MRRSSSTTLFRVVCASLLVPALLVAAEPEAKTPAVLDFHMNSLDGKPVDLSRYHGKVVLIVNTASKCGATPQYAALQQLHEKYAKSGLAVLGFPCNQFGRQEPGTAQDISTFCTENYGVTFDLFEKIEVNGDGQAPLYKYLTSKDTNPEHAGKVLWNFEKFLISRDGQIVARFRTGIEPDSDQVISAIEKELQKK